MNNKLATGALLLFGLFALGPVLHLTPEGILRSTRERRTPIVRVEDCKTSKVEVLGPGWILVTEKERSFEVYEPTKNFRIAASPMGTCEVISTY